MLEDLKGALRGYLDGQTSAGELHAAFDAARTDVPGQRDLLVRLLRSAQAAGLPDAMHAALMARLDEPPTATDAPDATVFLEPGPDGQPPVMRPEGAPDPTVLVSAGADPNPDATVLVPPGTGPDSDATVFAPAEDDEDATRVTQRRADSPPEDASPAQERTTPFTGSTATGRSPRDAAPASPDATVLARKKGPDDATVFAPESADPQREGGGAQGRVRTGTHGASDDDDPTTLAERAKAHGDATTVNTALDVAATSDGARGPVSDTGANRPTGPSSTRPPTATDGHVNYQAGHRIRDRFELISKLGEGGMGAVWKAKDLLKEEAQDRNPFVAMKLLTGDFRAHPAALIALQRESAKQQRLAHPNIATVFDFDKDAKTGTVFMTMEVMDGQPLDAFIRRLPAGGLPYADAMPLIEQLAAGLQYAHDNSLVHSDLKPGNCFLTKDGTVKLLDFGIARASKTTSDAGGEKTVFDPGQLGALTPAYATVEMFEGEDPDPRDDIYALAIIAYQLLTGNHPYGKKSAPKARELKLVPAPIAKLDKRQNRALRRGLAFHRADRPADVREFLTELRPRKSRLGTYVGGGIAVLVLLVAALYAPVMNEIHRREREAVIHVITAGGLAKLERGLKEANALTSGQRQLVLDDPRTVTAMIDYIAKDTAKSIDTGLALLKSEGAAWRKTVLDDPRAQKAIIDYYDGLRLAAADPAKKRYDFPAAERAVAHLKALYPNLASVYRIDTALQTQKAQLLNQLSEKYNNLLAAGQLLPNAQGNDVGTVLAEIRAVDPKNRLLADTGLKFAFAKQAETAIKAGNYTLAAQLLQASRTYAPNDPTLNDLRYQVQTALKREADKKLVADIVERLRKAYPGFKTLADFQRVRDDLLKLADLSPGNPLLNDIQKNLERAFSGALKRDMARRRWVAAEQLMVDYARLLEIGYLDTERQSLSQAERKAGFTLPNTPARRQAVAEREKRIRTLLAHPSFNGSWEIALKVPFKELVALLPYGDPSITPVRTAIAQVYVARAKQAADAGRFAEARAMLARGQPFYPEYQGLTAEAQAIASAEATLRAQRAAQERQAMLNRRKGDLLAAAQADDVRKATQILAELQKGLPAGDPFLKSTGPQAIAQAYLRLATQQAANSEYQNAVTLAKAGLALVPDLAALKTALASYEAEVAKRALQIAVGKQFAGSEALDAAALAPKLHQVKTEFAKDWARISDNYAKARLEALGRLRVRGAADLRTLAARIEQLKALLPQAYAAEEANAAALFGKRLATPALASTRDLSSLEAPLALARRLFPKDFPRVRDALGASLARRVETLQREKHPQQSFALLGAAAKLLPNNAQLQKMLREVGKPCPCLAGAEKLLAKGELSAANADLRQMKRVAPRHPTTLEFEQSYQARYDKAASLYRQALASYQARNLPRARNLLRQAMALWTDSTVMKKAATVILASPGGGNAAHRCDGGLAGYGRAARAQCWDRLPDKARGPIMVVVPAGHGFSHPFAIGKYEVSVQDWNQYCAQSHACKEHRGNDSALPVTEVSARAAEAYAAWLSKVTGARYTLPTDRQWVYAAKANGRQPPRNQFNCRVQSNGTIIKGQSLLEAQSGAPNGWGLVNYVGNAREWVRVGSGFAARGGAYDDPLTSCGIDLRKPSSGNASPATGFRLVRAVR